MKYPHLQGMLRSDLLDLISEAKTVLKERTPTFHAMKFEKMNRDNSFANFAQNKNTEIVEFNSSMPLTPRHHLGKRKLHAAGIYLPALLKQDWSELFQSECFSKEEKFYVYAHINPMLPSLNYADEAGGIWEGTPFYIGKGTGSRAFDLNRNQGHGKTLEKLKRSGVGKEKIVKIVFENLSEAKAYEIESKLIYFFGTVYGYSKGILYNLETPKTPKFCGVMKQMNLTEFKGIGETP